MRYAVMIDLDYEGYPYETLKFLWGEISDAMGEAGFHVDGRRFIIDEPPASAEKLARDALEGIESHLEFHRKHIYNYIKTCYGFDLEHTRNLLVPGTDEIMLGTQEH